MKDDDEVYNRFVNTSLRAERELYDIILTNIENRDGSQLAIEQSMLVSIKETCEQSGVNIEEVSQKSSNWGGNFEDKLKSLEIDRRGYVALQMIPSHAVHGDWVDLIKNHLLKKEDGFGPDFDWTQTDGELLSPIGVFVIDATLEYLAKYFGCRNTVPLQQRLVSLQERLMKVETSRQDWQVVG